MLMDSAKVLGGVTVICGLGSIACLLLDGIFKADSDKISDNTTRGVENFTNRNINKILGEN